MMNLLTEITQHLITKLSEGEGMFSPIQKNVQIGNHSINLSFKKSSQSQKDNVIFEHFGSTADLNSLDDLTALGGGQKLPEMPMPSGAPALENLLLSGIQITLDPSKKTCKKLVLQVLTYFNPTWFLVKDLFQFRFFALRITIYEPLTNRRGVNMAIVYNMPIWNTQLNTSWTRAQGLNLSLVKGQTLDFGTMITQYLESKQIADIPTGLKLDSFNLNYSKGTKRTTASGTFVDFPLINIGDNPIKIEAASLKLIHTAASTDGKTLASSLCSLRGKVTIGDIDFKIKTTAPDWTFTGEAAPEQPIPVGKMIDALAKKMGSTITIPSVLESATFSSLSFSYSNGDHTKISFHGEASMVLDAVKKANITLDITFTKAKNASSYDNTIKGILTIGKADFDIDLTTNTDKNTLTASWQATGNSVTLQDFILQFDSRVNNHLPSSLDDLALTTMDLKLIGTPTKPPKKGNKTSNGTRKKKENKAKSLKNKAKVVSQQKEVLPTATLLVDATGQVKNEKSALFFYTEQLEGQWIGATGIEVNANALSKITPFHQASSHLPVTIANSSFLLLASTLGGNQFTPTKAITNSFPNFADIIPATGLYLIAKTNIHELVGFLNKGTANLLPTETITNNSLTFADIIPDTSSVVSGVSKFIGFLNKATANSTQNSPKTFLVQLNINEPQGSKNIQATGKLVIGTAAFDISYTTSVNSVIREENEITTDKTTFSAGWQRTNGQAVTLQQIADLVNSDLGKKVPNVKTFETAHFTFETVTSKIAPVKNSSAIPQISTDTKFILDGTMENNGAAFIYAEYQKAWKATIGVTINGSNPHIQHAGGGIDENSHPNLLVLATNTKVSRIEVSNTIQKQFPALSKISLSEGIYVSANTSIENIGGFLENVASGNINTKLLAPTDASTKVQFHARINEQGQTITEDATLIIGSAVFKINKNSTKTLNASWRLKSGGMATVDDLFKAFGSTLDQDIPPSIRKWGLASATLQYTSDATKKTILFDAKTQNNEAIFVYGEHTGSWSGAFGVSLSVANLNSIPELTTVIEQLPDDPVSTILLASNLNQGSKITSNTTILNQFPALANLKVGKGLYLQADLPIDDIFGFLHQKTGIAMPASLNNGSLLIQIRETGKSAKQKIDASGQLTIGNSIFNVTYDSINQVKTITGTWKEADGGAVTLADFVSIFDKELSGKLTEAQDVGMTSATFKYTDPTRGTNRKVLKSFELDATFKGNSAGFMYAVYNKNGDRRWSNVFGLGLNSANLAVAHPLDTEAKSLSTSGDQFLLLGANDSFKDFKPSRTVATQFPQLANVKTTKGLFLVAQMPINEVFKLIKQEASDFPLPSINSSDTILIQISIDETKQVKTYSFSAVLKVATANISLSYQSSPKGKTLSGEWEAKNGGSVKFSDFLDLFELQLEDSVPEGFDKAFALDSITFDYFNGTGANLSTFFLDVTFGGNKAGFIYAEKATNKWTGAFGIEINRSKLGELSGKVNATNLAKAESLLGHGASLNVVVSNLTKAKIQPSKLLLSQFPGIQNLLVSPGFYMMANVPFKAAMDNMLIGNLLPQGSSNGTVMLDLSIKKGDDGKNELETSATLTYGTAKFKITVEKKVNNFSITAEWDASKGGEVTLKDFVGMFSPSAADKIPEGVNLALNSVSFTYRRAMVTATTSSFSLDATTTGGEAAFLYASHDSKGWNAAAGLGLNTDNLNKVPSLNTGASKIGISDELSFMMIISDMQGKVFKPTEKIKEQFKGIDKLVVKEGFYLVASLPIKTVLDGLHKATDNIFPTSTSDANVLLEIGFQDQETKTGLLVEILYPGPLEITHHFAIKDILFKFQIVSDEIKLRLAATSTINIGNFTGGQSKNPTFHKQNAFSEDEIDIIVSLDAVFGEGFSLEFTGLIKEQSGGNDVALFRAFPGLWIGAIEFMIGIIDGEPVLGLGAEVKVSPADKPPTFNEQGKNPTNSPFTSGGAFLVICQVEADILPFPIYVAIQEHNFSSAESVFIMFTGKAPSELDAGERFVYETIYLPLFEIIMGKYIIDINNFWGYYADPDQYKNIVLPDGTTPQHGGIGFQGTAKLIELFDVYFYFAGDIGGGGTSKVPANIIAEGVAESFTFGPFKLTAPFGKGASFPQYNAAGATLTSIEQFQSAAPLKIGAADNPYFRLNVDQLEFAAALQMIIGGATSTTQSQNTPDGLNIAAVIDIALRHAPKFDIYLAVELNLIEILKNIIDALADEIGGILGKIVKSAADFLLDILGAVINPSIDFNLTLNIDPETLYFNLQIKEFGLNDWLKITFDAPHYFDFSFTIDLEAIEDWILNMLKKLGKDIWHWLKSDLIDKILGPVIEFVAHLVEAIGQAFAAIAQQEWQGIQEIGEGLGDAFVDLFTGNFQNLGHDLEEIGEGIATICGFGTSHSDKTSKTNYKSVFLAPGGQVSLTLFENFDVAQHHIFWVDSSTSVQDKGPVLGGQISFYDRLRASAEQQRFVKLSDAISMRKYEPQTMYFEDMLGRAAKYTLLDANGTPIKDAKGNTQLLGFKGEETSFEMVQGRIKNVNDTNATYPYAMPTATLRPINSNLKKSMKVPTFTWWSNKMAWKNIPINTDTFSKNWFLMPSLYQPEGGDNNSYFSICYSSENASKLQENIIEARKQKTSAPSSQPAIQIKADFNLLYDWLKYQNNQKEDLNVCDSFKSMNDYKQNFNADVAKTQNDTSKALLYGEAGTFQTTVSGKNETVALPEHIALSPDFIESYDLNKFNADYDGFWLTANGGDNSILTARRIGNATDSKSLPPNKSKQVVSPTVSSSTTSSKNSGSDIYTFGTGVSAKQITGNDLLKTSAFIVKEEKDSKGNTIGFSLRSAMDNSLYIGQASNDIILTSDASKRLILSPEFINPSTAPAPRLTEIGELEFMAGSPAFNFSTAKVRIVNQSEETIYISFTNKENGVVFNNDKPLAAQQEALFSSSHANRFAVKNAQKQIIGIYRINSALIAGLVVTADMVKRYYDITRYTNPYVNPLAKISQEQIGVITASDNQFIVDLTFANISNTDYSLWELTKDGLFKDTGEILRANHFTYWHSKKTSAVFAIRDLKSLEFLALYQFKSSIQSGNKIQEGCNLYNFRPMSIDGHVGIINIPSNNFNSITPIVGKYSVNIYNKTNTLLEVWFTDEQGFFTEKGKVSLSYTQTFTNVQSSNNLIGIVNAKTKKFIGIYQVTNLGKPARIVQTSIKALNLSVSKTINAVGLNSNQFEMIIPEFVFPTIYFYNNTDQKLEIHFVNRIGLFSDGKELTIEKNQFITFSDEGSTNILAIYAPNSKKYVGLYELNTTAKHVQVYLDSLTPMILGNIGVNSIATNKFNQVQPSKGNYTLVFENKTNLNLEIWTTDYQGFYTEINKISIESSVLNREVQLNSNVLGVVNAATKEFIGLYQITASDKGRIVQTSSNALNLSISKTINITALNGNQLGMVKPVNSTTNLCFYNRTDKDVEIWYADETGLFSKGSKLMIPSSKLTLYSNHILTNIFVIYTPDSNQIIGLYQTNPAALNAQILINSLQPIPISNAGLESVSFDNIAIDQLMEKDFRLTVINETVDEIKVLTVNTDSYTSESYKNLNETIQMKGRMGIYKMPKNLNAFGLWNNTKNALVGFYKVNPIHGLALVSINDKHNHPIISNFNIQPIDINSYGIIPSTPLDLDRSIIVNATPSNLISRFANEDGLFLSNNQLVTSPYNIHFTKVGKRSNLINVGYDYITYFSRGVYKITGNSFRVIATDKILSLPQVTKLGQVNILKGINVLAKIPSVTSKVKQINFANETNIGIQLYGVSNKAHLLNFDNSTFSTGTNKIPPYGQVRLKRESSDPSFEYLMVTVENSHRVIGYYQILDEVVYIAQCSTETLELLNDGPFSEQVSLHLPSTSKENHDKAVYDHIDGSKMLNDYRMIEPLVNIYNGSSVPIKVAGLAKNGKIADGYGWSNLASEETFLAFGVDKKTIPNWLLIGHVNPVDNTTKPVAMVYIRVITGTVVRLITSNAPETLDLIELKGEYILQPYQFPKHLIKERMGNFPLSNLGYFKEKSDFSMASSYCYGLGSSNKSSKIQLQLISKNEKPFERQVEPSLLTLAHLGSYTFIFNKEKNGISIKAIGRKESSEDYTVLNKFYYNDLKENISSTKYITDNEELQIPCGNIDDVHTMNSYITLGYRVEDYQLETMVFMVDKTNNSATIVRIYEKDYSADTYSGFVVETFTQSIPFLSLENAVSLNIRFGTHEGIRNVLFVESMNQLKFVAINYPVGIHNSWLNFEANDYFRTPIKRVTEEYSKKLEDLNIIYQPKVTFFNKNNSNRRTNVIYKVLITDKNDNTLYYTFVATLSFSFEYRRESNNIYILLDTPIDDYVIYAPKYLGMDYINSIDIGSNDDRNIIISAISEEKKEEAVFDILSCSPSRANSVSYDEIKTVVKSLELPKGTIIETICPAFLNQKDCYFIRTMEGNYIIHYYKTGNHWVGANKSILKPTSLTKLDKIPSFQIVLLKKYLGRDFFLDDKSILHLATKQNYFISFDVAITQLSFIDLPFSRVNQLLIVTKKNDKGISLYGINDNQRYCFTRFSYKDMISKNASLDNSKEEDVVLIQNASLKLEGNDFIIVYDKNYGLFIVSLNFFWNYYPKTKVESQPPSKSTVYIYFIAKPKTPISRMSTNEMTTNGSFFRNLIYSYGEDNSKYILKQYFHEEDSWNVKDIDLKIEKDKVLDLQIGSKDHLYVLLTSGLVKRYEFDTGKLELIGSSDVTNREFLVIGVSLYLLNEKGIFIQSTQTENIPVVWLLEGNTSTIKSLFFKDNAIHYFDISNNIYKYIDGQKWEKVYPV